MTVISIVVPILNEKTIIPVFYERAIKVINQIDAQFEIIFIDDGSTDGTLDVLKDFGCQDNRIRILSFTRNFGHQAAITAGLDYSRGDAVIIIDGDLQDPPELFIEMIKKWREGFYVVYAKRKKRKGETLFKKTTAKIFYRFFQIFTDITIPLDTGDFRLLDRKVVNAVKGMKESHRFIRGMVSWVGYSQIGIEYERDERFAGDTKYTLAKMVRFASNAIFSFSDKPLRLATIMGLSASFIGLVMILWGLYSKFYLSQSTVRGWTSVFISILFLGGIQLFTLGIMGEYIGRIYDEIKNRPMYLVSEKVNFKENKSCIQGID
ncbi:glycosyltransferase [candidate division KSB1 bacterium]|nr:glycosyltransferase [candidate division KSB1 bacterium]